MDFISQVKNIEIMPKLNVISGIFKIYKDTDNKVYVKLKDSDSIPLNGEDREIFLRTFERWLSGQYLFDQRKLEEEKKNNNNSNDNDNDNNSFKFYYSTRFNRNNLLFTGSPNPKIKINEHFMSTSYADIAEIFLILYNV